MKPRTYNDTVGRLALVEVEFYKMVNDAFKQTRLGRIKEMIPYKELADDIRKKMPKRKSKAGRKELIPLEAQILLMFLRSYYQVSDERLVELLNGSWEIQMFCGIVIDPLEPIKSGKYVSDIRNKLAKYIDFKEFQKRCADLWKPDMEDLETCLMDATCFESYLRYPTDPKLLWECCDWMHTLIKRKCGKDILNIRMPINQYSKVSKRYLSYAKTRNKNRSKKRKKNTKKTNNNKKVNKKNTLTTSMIRCLLHLVEKMLNQWDELYQKYYSGLIMTMTSEEKKRLQAVRDVLDQQKKLFSGEKIENRIVSIDRPHLRPMVRGKETKKVEFGGKANLIQVDGLSFIQKLSFDAFNECKELKTSLEFHEYLFGVKVSKLGADAIYATNENRTICKDIITNFAPKGRKPAEDNTRKVRVAIAKVRACSMEGCFGNQKEHYDLRRIRARNKASEEIQILIAVMMSNAAIMADRKELKESCKAKEKKRA